MPIYRHATNRSISLYSYRYYGGTCGLKTKWFQKAGYNTIHCEDFDHKLLAIQRRYKNRLWWRRISCYNSTGTGTNISNNEICSSFVLENILIRLENRFIMTLSLDRTTWSWLDLILSMVQTIAVVMTLCPIYRFCRVVTYDLASSSVGKCRNSKKYPGTCFI